MPMAQGLISQAFCISGCRSAELVKTFAEDLMSVALHPAGHMLLAGCIDKLRLLTITMDSLR